MKRMDGPILVSYISLFPECPILEDMPGSIE